MRALAAAAAQQGDAVAAVEQRGQAVEIASAGGVTDRRAPAAGPSGCGGGASAAGCSATSPGMTITDDAAFGRPRARIAISSTRGIWSGLETSSQ